MSANITCNIEFHNGSSWVSLWPDVKTLKTLQHHHGLPGNKPTIRVASPGKLNFKLNNSIYNSAGSAGLYSPDHANYRANFGHGKQIRVKYTYGTLVKEAWRGWIWDVDPIAGNFLDRESTITAYDWMWDASRQLIRGVAVSTEQRADQMITTALATLPAEKRITTSMDTGESTFPYAFDKEKDEKTAILGIMNKAALTEIGYMYVEAGTLIFENRYHRINEPTSQYTFTGTVTPSLRVNEVKYPGKDVFTRTKARVYPREVDSGTVVLATLQRAIRVGFGGTEHVTVYFRDPNGDARVSALEVVAPEVGTDWNAKANEDGTGTDMSDDFIVTHVSEGTGGNAAEFEFINNSATMVGWVIPCQVRGRGIYHNDPITAEFVAGTAVFAKYGDVTFTYDMPYEDDDAIARDFSSWLGEQVQSPKLNIISISFYPEMHADLATAFMTIRAGHRITLGEDLIGIDVDFFVHKIDVSHESGRLKVTYGLSQPDTGGFMKLDDSVYGVLDSSVCRLGF